MRRHGVAACHQLHYLQMVTEKLGKAYFWLTGNPPRKSHASFVRFLQALDNRPSADRLRIANLFGFGRAQDFENWIPTITPSPTRWNVWRRPWLATAVPIRSILGPGKPPPMPQQLSVLMSGANWSRRGVGDNDLT